MKLSISTLALTLSLACTAAHSDPLQDAAAAIHRKDYPTAVRLLEPLAKAGDPVAQTRLGTLYYHGHGVRESDELAAQLPNQMQRRHELFGHLVTHMIVDSMLRPALDIRTDDEACGTQHPPRIDTILEQDDIRRGARRMASDRASIGGRAGLRQLRLYEWILFLFAHNVLVNNSAPLTSAESGPMVSYRLSSTSREWRAATSHSRRW